MYFTFGYNIAICDTYRLAYCHVRINESAVDNSSVTTLLLAAEFVLETTILFSVGVVSAVFGT